MRSRLLRLLIGGVALGTLGARAEILFDQMTNPSNTIIPSSWVTPDGSDSDSYAWDNFLLPSDSTINEVWWVGGGGTITGLTIRFYTGLAGYPDYQPTITALPESEQSTDYLKGYRFTGNGNETPIPGTSLYQYHVTLPTPLSLPGNTVFWIKIEGDMVTYPSWGVAMSTHGRDNRHFAYFTGLHRFFALTGSEAFQLRGTSAAATVTGSIDLQDYFGAIAGIPCEVLLIQNGATVDSQTVTLASDGSYSIQTSVRGLVTVRAKAWHWLRASSAELDLTNAGLTGVDFSLLNGDVDTDNEVAIGDYSLLSAAFNSAPGDANWDPASDLNGDDGVDIGDYAILSANYGVVGD